MPQHPDLDRNYVRSKIRPLLALSGRADLAELCLLLGEERTHRGRASTSASDPKRTWSAIASRGPHEARIYEPAMEGQNLAPRLTSEIPTLTRHHQPLAFSLRR